MFREARTSVAIVCIMIAFISLCATVTNLVYASMLFAVLVVFLPYLLLANRTQPRVVLSVICLLFYFVLSTLAYAPSSLVEFDFYRRDGNVFISFLPILLYGLLRFPVNVERVVCVFIKWATVVNLAVMGLYIVTHGGPFHYSDGIYHFLFVAHNAAGAYLATLVAISIGLLKSPARRTQIPLIAINLLGLYLTDSRGSMFGLAMALIVIYVFKGRHAGKLVALGGLVTCSLLYFTYPIWLSSGQATGGYSLEGQSLAIERSGTIISRAAFVWPRALYLWIESPIFGTGFGSYNDIPYELGGIEHVLMWNSNKHVVFSDAHAHHTYLHVMAETGIVGLLLLIWVMVEMNRAILMLKPDSIKYGLLLLFWLAVWSSMTEHRFFTPAQMLPFTLILGLAIADHRARAQASKALDTRSPEPVS